jgi:hypothetical protein
MPRGSCVHVSKSSAPKTSFLTGNLDSNNGRQLVRFSGVAALEAGMFLMLMACSVPTSEFEIFAGFQFEWDNLSHRISRIEAVVGGEDGNQMAMVGGDWSTGESFSDFLNYRLPTLEVQNAKAGLGQVRVELTIPVPDSPGENEDEPTATWATGIARIPISEVGAWEVYTPVIQGFGIRTDVAQSGDFPDDYDPANGYALGRLAVSLGPAERGETEVVVPVSLLFVAGDTGEAILDRPEMNASIPFAQFNGWVEVGVVGHLRKGTDVPVEATGTHAYAPPYSEQPPSLVNLGLPEGRLALWQTLSFEANPGGSGDYIRNMGAELYGGERVEGARLQLGNSSVYELDQFSYEVSGSLSMVDLGRSARVYLRIREGESEIGSWAP